jgi:hypothetical protein
MKKQDSVNYSVTNMSFEFLLKESNINKYNNLPIMKLLNAGKPKSEESVIEIINKHAANTGALSFQGMKDKLLSMQSESGYSAAMANKKLPRLTQSEIDVSARFYLLERNLKAYKMEQKAQLIMKQVFPATSIFSSEVLDIKYAIDFALCEYGTNVHCCGIQVKPVSHTYSNDVDPSAMHQKHRLYKDDYKNTGVFILNYGKDYFENLPKIIADIYEHLNIKFDYDASFNANNDYK